MNESQSGTIFDIKRFSINDGPGIRTTVFFKGCPLRCVWCHNPEGLSDRPQVFWEERRCMGDRHQCAVSCPKGALHRTDSGWVIDGDTCDLCEECARQCPTEAFRLIGRRMDADDVVAAVIKDRVFFDTSGGGVTFSGGEPLMQHRFLKVLLARCKEAGIHTAVDTCGYASWKVMAPLLPATDLFLYDIKLVDDAAHKRYTGVSNRTILENLKRLAEGHKEVLIRIPLIPGIVASERNIFDSIALLKGLPGLKNVSLLNFHQGGRQKYHRSGLDYPVSDMVPLGDDAVAAIVHEFRKNGFSVTLGE
ncbi:MAG: glycyl-radical enzyme activating protein [Chitinispirillaceae bacterium]|nr:glycyl-radical enzyme activating protein [Chitinispirillaceae bacterium]